MDICWLTFSDHGDPWKGVGNADAGRDEGHAHDRVGDAQGEADHRDHPHHEVGEERDPDYGEDERGHVGVGPGLLAAVCNGLRWHGCGACSGQQCSWAGSWSNQSTLTWDGVVGHRVQRVHDGPLGQLQLVPAVRFRPGIVLGLPVVLVVLGVVADAAGLAPHRRQGNLDSVAAVPIHLDLVVGLGPVFHHLVGGVGAALFGVGPGLGHRHLAGDNLLYPGAEGHGHAVDDVQHQEEERLGPDVTDKQKKIIEIMKPTELADNDQNSLGSMMQ